MIRRLEQGHREAGCVTPVAHANADRPRTVRTPANEDTATAGVEKLTRHGARTALSQPKVLEVLHDDQLHPHHFSRIPRVFSEDCPLRMKFCEWLHEHTAYELSHNILCTDEARFTPSANVGVGVLGWNRLGHCRGPHLLTG